MSKNIDEVIGMAWSDKVSFEEIKKKNRSYRSRCNIYHEKKFKKKKLYNLEKKG